MIYKSPLIKDELRMLREIQAGAGPGLQVITGLAVRDGSKFLTNIEQLPVRVTEEPVMSAQK